MIKRNQQKLKALEPFITNGFRAFILLHIKFFMDMNHCFFATFFINQTGNLDFRGADGLDVDTQFKQRFEELGGNFGIGHNPGTDH